MNIRNGVRYQIRIYHLLFYILIIILFQCVLLSNVRGQNTTDGDSFQISSHERAAIIDTVISKLNELYVYPEIAKKMSIYIKDKQNNHTYDNIHTLDKFVHQLTNDLLSIFPDGHLEIRVLQKRGVDMHPGESEEDWWDRRVKETQYNNFYFRKVEWLPGNVGYLDIRKFEFATISGPTAIAVMQFLAYSDALIIDLRQNPGGRGELTQLFFSYFFEDHRVHYGTTQDNNRNITKQWWTIPYVPGQRMPDIPIYILTSRGTGSAAEEFAYALKHLDRAVIIGDTTAGAAHTTHRHMYPELNIEIHMPDSRTINPKTGKDWEGIGVVPHISVSPEKAFDVAYAEALDTLYKNMTEDIEKFRIEWIKKDLDAKLNPITLDIKTMKKYVGIYGFRKIILEKGVLFYQRENRPRHRLIPLGDEWYKLDDLDYFRIQFTTDESGNVAELIGVYDDGRRDTTIRTNK